MSKARVSHETDHSEDEQGPSTQTESSRKRSSRACDQCRKTKSKCERFEGDIEPCKSCALAGVACTFLGPSFKRGPPKGYIHAIEQRWHQVESVLGAILASEDPQVTTLISNMKKDDLARDILNRVNAGPFGPTGRLNHSVAVTKEDFFASIMNSAETQASRDPSRPRRHSRMSREIVSSNNSMLVTPTLEWQDRLSSTFARIGPVVTDPSSSTSRHDSPDGQRLAQRRRLDRDGGGQPDWDRMYKIDKVTSDTDEDGETMLGQLSLDENNEVRHHNQASGLHLLSQANRTDQRNAGGIWNLPMARVWPPALNQFIPEQNVDVNMPPIATQRHLLDLYFTYVHPQYPIIHKTLFWIDFEAINSPSRVPSTEKLHISNLLLLSMFAIAARYDDQEALPAAGNIWEAGLEYMVQAREVLNRVYHYCRPSTCASLLLLGVREFGIGQMEHGWLYVGMGLRMAMDLGLHRDASGWRTNGKNIFSPMELQSRRQLWWAGNKADKFSAGYMGRPPAIIEANYDTPLPELEPDEPWQPHISDPSSATFPPVPGRVMACFRACSAMTAIMGSIIDKVYPVRPVSHSIKRAALVELEGRLDQWYADLPESLSYDVAGKRFVPPPHVLIMHMTYWHSVLLLHRAFIPKWRPAGSKRSSQSTDSMSLKAFDICQSAATHITNIAVAYQTQFTLRRVTMFLTQHLFAAGIMHIVTLTMRPSNMQTSLALQRVLSCLHEMSAIWPSARRAWELLSGAHVHVDNTILSHRGTSNERLKRPAEESIIGSEKVSDVLQQEAFDENGHPRAGPDSPVSPVPANAANRVLAHMLGIDIPGIEPSTSYLPGYEWWPRNGAGVPTNPNGNGNGVVGSQPPSMPTTSSAAQTNDSPSPHSSASSPPSNMSIPFSFDATQNFWAGAITGPQNGLNGLGNVNGVNGLGGSPEFTAPGSFTSTLQE
ncbi:fungal-specific transcription factor domain-containing protein [Amylostereum chailletii]|nr:fungal-specific transcription factor domain-containing protein [Amylostereum chailletii]